MTMPRNDVTTVIATRNGADRLVRLLPRHTGPVVVVDNGSDDGSPERIARRCPDIPLIRLRHNAGAAARNVGVARAATPYVAFADDDSYWMGDSLGRAAAILRDNPTAGLLTGTVLVGPEHRIDPLSARMATAPLGVHRGQPGPAVLGFLACATVVRRQAFLAVGGFNARLHIYGEEDLLALDLAAAGWSLSYVRSLYVHHLPGTNGRDPSARRRVEARNRILTAVLRRPPAVVARTVAGAARRRDDRRGIVAAVPALPWAIAHRRTLPPPVESARSTLDRM
jgi:N-acetylglucosaminyl-diphospho-decaprenol L-rhamnosyltransferase